MFAQNVQPDKAEITVKNPVIKWEATNLEIAMTKNGSPVSSYNGSIYMTITDEDWNNLKENEYTLPNRWSYIFEPSDLWKKTFQRWLEINKEWKFYIEIYDRDDKFYWRQEITVVNWITSQSQHDITVHTPINWSTLINEKVEIIANCSDLPNSNVLIYLDNQSVSTTMTDENWWINYVLPNISQWKHSLMLEIIDIEWNSLWVSETISFVYTPENNQLFKSINIDPQDWYFIWDVISISVETTELAESVKLRLSDRGDNESIIMSKNWNGVFTQNVFLLYTWNISLSLDIYSANNTQTENQNNVKTIQVSDLPEIYNITTDIDADESKASIIWNTKNRESVSYFVIDYWFTQDQTDWKSTSTATESFIFKNVPYDKDVYYQITPYINDWNRHWSASDTIQFIIRKPSALSPLCWDREFSCDRGNVMNAERTDDWYVRQCTNEDDILVDCRKDISTGIMPTYDPECWTQPFTCIWWSVDNTWWDIKQWFSWLCINNEWTILKCETEPDRSCNIENIKTHTEKIWDKYYLVWDKVENMEKYVVYSSETPNISDRIKVYETSDTSYEYPFDHSVEEAQFMYFWVDGICADWEELQLSWATKVQVWPAEDFFLLVCLTILIFAWIKIFRFTEE